MILNGPSSAWARDHILHPRLWVCNLAIKDWPATDCVCIDRPMVRHLTEQGLDPQVKYWTKTHPEPFLGWQVVQPVPGVDSGTMAIDLALQHDDVVEVWGADGILGGVINTQYQYTWHPRGPTERSRKLHQIAAGKLVKKYADRIIWRWPAPIPGWNCQPPINIMGDTPWPNQ